MHEMCGWLDLSSLCSLLWTRERRMGVGPALHCVYVGKKAVIIHPHSSVFMASDYSCY